MTTQPGRRLIWIPIVHSAEDLGSLQGPVRRMVEERGGTRQWQEQIRATAQFWRSIRDALLRLELDWPKTRLYQDGLPVCGHERRIVQDLAQAGSPNHRLLMEMMARGAELMGTECPDLLIEEYELNRQLLLGHPPRTEARSNGSDVRNLGRQLLDSRDAFIANRIVETLGPGETGCLFLGLLHSLEGRIPEGIEVTRLGLTPVGRA